MGNDMTDAQAGDTDGEFGQATLFFDGDGVAIAVQAQCLETPRAGYRDQGAPPRVPDPPARFVQQRRGGFRAQPAQVVQLGAVVIEGLDMGFGSKPIENGRVSRIPGVQNLRTIFIRISVMHYRLPILGIVLCRRAPRLESPFFGTFTIG